MNILDALLGRKQAVPVPEAATAPAGVPEVVAEEIPVTGDGIAPTRRGMFGIRGTFRDVLGTLGDALLINSGRQAIYRPQRQNERRADAMRGFQDPETQAGAISRLAREGFPEEAAEMYQQMIQNRRLGRAADLDYETRVNTNGRQLLNGVDERSYGPALARMRQYYTSRGLTPPELPDQYDPVAVEGFLNSGLTVDQYIDNRDLREHRAETLGVQRQRAATSAAQGRERIGISRGNLEVARRNAGRPRVVDRYTRSDGRRVRVYEGGQEVPSQGTVQQPSRRGGRRTGQGANRPRYGGLDSNGQPVFQ